MSALGAAENSPKVVLPVGGTRGYEVPPQDGTTGGADVRAVRGTTEGTVVRWLREGGIDGPTIVCLMLANVPCWVLLWVALH